MIILLGSETDPQIRHLYNRLLERGQTPWALDTQQFGCQWTLSFLPDSAVGAIECTNQRVPWTHITAVYWHQYRPPAGTQDSARSHMMDHVSTLQSWFRCPAIHWVNGIDAIRYHQCKPIQLQHARQLGVQIPATWIGNNSESALAFARDHQTLIVKPVHGGETATRLNSQDTERLCARLALSPATVQACIPGTNIRTYVIGEKVFHFALDTTHTDFRTDTTVVPEVASAPDAVTQQAKAICRAFGMHWCAIDWRRTGDNTYYFLEANPCPYFLYVENTTGVDLSGALMTLLISRDKQKSP
ncbi:ATP-grasp domain-containing protein [Alteromonas halophila]|uniref:ATP-grasp domain-containing protein n=1 Tax=Alteromonas halophila TaxID=516698 RepID=A0A918JI80_9ALTE|nr:hypothetical protein [Alteromonas halophila]GGW82863.1 hypothetical protein GCM10007391_15050 [Alteromonas halophila]